MKSLEQIFSPLIKQDDNNEINQNIASQNGGLENFSNYDDQQLLDLAIKQSLEQENLEIEKDKEEQLIQLAILNSILEINETKEKEKIKEEKKEETIKLNEEKEEEKFDENFGICPIKLEYMKHPMLTPSGNYYERSAIIDWINKNHTDPMTRENLTVDMLIEDKEFSKKIKEYKKKFKKQIKQLDE